MTSTNHQWDGKGQGTPLGYKFFMVTTRLLGLKPAYFFLGFVAFYYVLRDRKAAAAVRDLRRRLGLRTTVADIHRHFFAFGQCIIDRLTFLLRDRPPFNYTCINEELIRTEAGNGRGLILLGAHVGNWEVAGNLLYDRIRMTINIVMLDAERETLQRAMAGALRQRRMNIIPLVTDGPDTMIRIVHALRHGEVVALLGDRSLGETTELINFLGSPAPFPRGPFAIAAATGAPIIPIMTLKTGPRRYTFQAWDRIRLDDVARHDRDAAIRNAMERWVNILEGIVERNPEQWYNFYNFWEQ